jgi:acylphosphatase
MNVRVRLLISGEVQGVFFRSNTRDIARRLGLKGWVRNLPDGRVECAVEGEKEKVERMIGFCREGPPGSRVENLEIKWERPKNESGGFEVRY